MELVLRIQCLIPIYRDMTWYRWRRYPKVHFASIPTLQFDRISVYTWAIPFKTCHGMQESQSFIHALPGATPFWVTEHECYRLPRSKDRSLTHRFHRLPIFTPRQPTRAVQTSTIRQKRRYKCAILVQDYGDDWCAVLCIYQFFTLGSSRNASPIMAMAFCICASVMTNGGANRMMSPCVGFAYMKVSTGTTNPLVT